MPKGVYKKTEEHKRNLCKSLKGKNKGVPLDERGHGPDCTCCMCKAKRKDPEFIEMRKVVQTELWQDPEYRKKQSEAMEGHVVSEESNKKRSKTMKDNYASGYVSPMKGKPAVPKSEDGIRRLSERMIGEKNPSWRGGVWDDPYPKEFIHIREEVKVRDDYQCQLCGKLEIDEKRKLNRGLPVHHIDYDKQNCNSTNLITLCCSCNSKVNTNREFWTNFFRLKLRETLLIK